MIIINIYILLIISTQSLSLFVFLVIMKGGWQEYSGMGKTWK